MKFEYCNQMQNNLNFKNILDYNINKISFDWTRISFLHSQFYLKLWLHLAWQMVSGLKPFHKFWHMTHWTRVKIEVLGWNEFFG